MTRLQIKYCNTEEEANEFLKTLSVSVGPTSSGFGSNKLHTIQYCAGVHGNSTNDDISINSGITAIIQFFVEVDD